jgi:hypothetical protein
MQPVVETEPIIDTRGDDWTWPLQLTDDNGAPIDLTGCSFDDAAIKWRDGSLPLSVDNGRLTINPTAGSVTVTIARADTIGVPDGQRARAVIPIIDTLGQKSTLLIVPIQVIAP